MSFEQFVSERGPDISLEQATAIADAMQSATPGQLHELRASASAATGPNSLPLLDAVAIGGRSLGLRGAPSTSRLPCASMALPARRAGSTTSIETATRDPTPPFAR